MSASATLKWHGNLLPSRERSNCLLLHNAASPCVLSCALSPPRPCPVPALSLPSPCPAGGPPLTCPTPSAVRRLTCGGYIAAPRSSQHFCSARACHSTFSHASRPVSAFTAGPAETGGYKQSWSRSFMPLTSLSSAPALLSSLASYLPTPTAHLSAAAWTPP